MHPQIDLHSHSTASDGTLAPAELARRAAGAGVELIALTDHDTTEGVAEAAAAAREAGVGFLPGVEVSVTWNKGTVHVLGLGVDPADAALEAGLRGLREYRDWRAEEIGRRLYRDKGIEGAFEGARALSNGRLVSRTHFARHLVSLGVEPDVRRVFRRYLVQGKPGHVPGEWATLEEAVGWIRGAGGRAVIAHPARYRMTRARLRRLLAAFRAAGGEGLEVVSGSHSREECLLMARHAAEFGLLASAGSDYHGPEDPWMHLGELPPLPPGCTPIWRDWAPFEVRRHAAL
ncbi:MAG: PHP domain-containing protein [Chromatiales bacterium]|jgi:predicted metal-dependent phosphoesterase TrpH